MGVAGMASGTGLGGGIRAAFGAGSPAVRRDERRARRELSRGMSETAQARERFLGQVAPTGRLYDQQLNAASARMGDADRGFQTVFDTLMGAAGGAGGGAPQGLGQSLLARQREQIGQGTSEAQRSILQNLSQRGLSRSGLGARLLGQNQLQGQSQMAQAETGVRMQAVGGLQNFLAQQMPLQMQRFQMGGQMPFQIQQVLQQLLSMTQAGRAGRAELFNTQAARQAADNEAWNQRLHQLAMSAFGMIGARGAGGGGGGGPSAAGLQQPYLQRGHYGG